jgi:molybdenum-dependent DNA-binding transcriptional regulator ModE
MSDSSRKIRKKRNTYQKISDDIRVQLLDAVQNGETLKSAAKRHKINYSSAKSILHTYRKEGRILKKSAQERTTKKRSSPTEIERPSKISKLSRKENMQPEEEETASQSYNTSSDKKHDVHDENGEANNHVMGLLSSNYDHHADHDIQAPSEVAPPSGHHAYPKSDGPLTVRKHDNIAEPHHGDYQKGAKGDHPNYKGRSYDSSHAGHHGEHDAAAAEHYHHGHYSGHPGHGHHDHSSNYYNYSRDIDSFNDAVNMWQARSAHQQDPAFLPYGRYALPAHHHDTHKDGLHHDYEDHGDSSVGYLLKSFMDIQSNHYHHQQQPIRKSSFVSYTGNGFRKESFDFI